MCRAVGSLPLTEHPGRKPERVGPSDGELRDGVLAGDPACFRELVAAHQRRLYAFALRLMGTEAAAMDLTQDVFVEAWRGMRRFRGDSSLSSWLHGIAVRLAKQRWRRWGRREKREREYAGWAYDAAVQRSMAGASIDLERGIARLPPRMRTALVLHCIDGLPQKEVAAVMGIAEGTVKAHIHKARAALKEMLE